MLDQRKTSNGTIELTLWDTTISYDKKELRLRAFSDFLEERAAKSATAFLDIGKQRKNGWLIAGTDFLGNEMRQVCDVVGAYIVRHNIMPAPNWKMYLEPWELIAEASKLNLLKLYEELKIDCRKNLQTKADAAYRQSIENSEGLGFGIISNSLADHLIYAVLAAKKEAENERKAQKAAQEVFKNSDSRFSAEEKITEVYFDTHEPFVLDTLGSFYGSIEQFVYNGVECNKTMLDSLDADAKSVLEMDDEIDERCKITGALQKNICCGEAILHAVSNRLVDEELIEFCVYAPTLLLKKAVNPIIEHLKKEKRVNLLYNRPLFDEKTLSFLTDLQKVYTDDSQKYDLYDRIIESVYSEEIESTISLFRDLFTFDSVLLRKYVDDSLLFSISREAIELLVLLCNKVDCRKIIKMTKAVGTTVPLTEDQIYKLIASRNGDIQDYRDELQRKEREKAEREATEKAEAARRKAIKDAENAARIAAEKERRAAEQLAFEQERKERNKRLQKKAIKIFVPTVIVVLVILLYVWPQVLYPHVSYNNALAYLEAGQDQKAFDILYDLHPYKDTETLLKQFEFVIASRESEEWKETYNQNGQVLELVYNDGVKHAYSYNDDGYLIEKNITGSTYENTTTAYWYNDQGQVVKERVLGSFNSKKLKEQLIEYKYDEAGRLMRRVFTFVYSDRKDYNLTFYEYDEVGNLVYEFEVVVFDGYTDSSEYTEYRNNRMGQCISKIKYDSRAIASTNDFLYSYRLGEDFRNRIMELSDVVIAFDYEYNENGDIVKETEIYNGNKTVTEYLYNDGVLVQESDRDYCYTYVYDDFGNLKEVLNYGELYLKYTHTPRFVGNID